MKLKSTKINKVLAIIFILFTALLGPGGASRAGAADEGNAAKNYVFTFYGSDNGLTSEFVTAITANPSDTSDILVGTWDGIAVFDGESFRYLGHSNRIDGIVPKNITSLCYDPQGNLWIGTIFNENAGLFKYRDGQFRRYCELDGLSNNNITSLAADHENVYCGTWGGGLAIFDGEKFTHINKKNGLSDDFISCVAIDAAKKTLWAGTKFYGANLIRNSTAEIMDDHTSSIVNNNVHTILSDPLQNITFFGTSGGMSKYNGATWQNIIKGKGPESISDNYVKAGFLYKNIMYFATGAGLSIISDGKYMNIDFDETAGFKQCQIQTIFVNDNYIYLGTDRGLCKIGRRN